MVEGEQEVGTTNLSDIFGITEHFFQSMSLSILGHHTNIHARLFIRVMPRWASSNSSRTALRCREGTITRDPRSIHPSYKESSALRMK